MLFNSYVFLFGFLPVTLAVFFLLGRPRPAGPALAWLFAASLFFYAWWNPADLPFLLLSIALNYSLAVALRRRAATIAVRRLAASGIAANLLFLGYYKYAGFVVANLNAVCGHVLAGRPTDRCRWRSPSSPSSRSSSWSTRTAAARGPRSAALRTVRHLLPAPPRRPDRPGTRS